MRILFVSFFIVIADQITKLFVKGFSIPFLNIRFEGMSLGERIDVFGSFIRITFVENPGMAFGIDVGLSSKLFLSIFSIIASAGIIFYLYKVRNENLITRLSLALILGGAIGNLIDRAFYGIAFDYAPLFYGKVVDFIDVDFFDINLFGYTYDRWPIFNIADLSVSIGVLLLIFFSKRKEETEAENDLIPVEEELIGKEKTKDEIGPEPIDEKNIFKPDQIKNNLSAGNDKPDIGKEIQI